MSTKTVWLDLDEAAQQVGKSVRTLRRWHDAGVLHIVEGHVAADQLMKADRSMRDRNPAVRASPVVALARDLGIEPTVLREELKAIAMRSK